MKFNKLFLVATFSSLASAIGSDFFEGIKRAELFEMTDLNMPIIRINLSEKDYNRLQLTYKCLYDTHPSIENYNEDCYKAPWVDYPDILNQLIQDGTIDPGMLTLEVQNIVDNPEITYEEFSSIINNYSSLPMKEVFSQGHSYVNIPNFEEKHASLEFYLNDVPRASRQDVKVSVGGKYTQVFEKPQYNINIKDGDLFGRSQLRLRSEVIDPSFLRTKIGSDLTDILGLPSVQASYTKLYINKDDMGLYLIRDAFKPEWVEANFGIANTTSLYTCDADYGTSEYFNCINDDTEEVDADYEEFAQNMENAENYYDYAEFFDVDLYIKWQAYKYLTGSWDHITCQHNQFLFKNGNKWMNFLYDFDSDFGAFKKPNPQQTFFEHDLEKDLPLHKKLQLDETNEQLIGYIKELVINGFNPVKLFPRIDELVEYLSPYIAEDRYPINNPTERPGHFERPTYKIENSFTIQDHFNNAQFHNYFLKKYYSSTSFETEEIFGLKRWIIERFRFACSNYNIDCSFASEYLENGTFNLPDREMTEIVVEEHQDGCRQSGYPCCKYMDSEVITVDDAGEWSIEGNVWCLFDRDLPEQVEEAPISYAVSNAVSNAVANCWAKEYNYPCCKQSKKILYTDPEKNKWSVEDHKWCGIA